MAEQLVSTRDVVSQTLTEYSRLQCLKKFDDISNRRKKKARKAHGLGIEENILAILDNGIRKNGKTSVLFLADGLYIKPSFAKTNKLLWRDIVSAELKEGDFVIQHIEKGEEKHSQFPTADFFFRGEEDSHMKLASLITEIAKSITGPREKTLAELEELSDGPADNANLKRMLQLCDELERNNPEDFAGPYYRSIAYFKNEEYERSRAELEKFWIMLNPYLETDEAARLKNTRLTLKKDWLNKCFSGALRHCELDILCQCVSFDTLENLGHAKDFSESTQDKQNVERLERKLKDSYTCQIFEGTDYMDRKVIMVTAKESMPSTESFRMVPWGFAKQLSFPPNHPVKETLYVGHPCKPLVYMPIETYMDDLMVDKLMESLRLFQALGAESVEVTSTTKVDEELQRKIDTQVRAKVGFKGHKGTAGYSRSGESAADTSFRRETILEQRFDPQKEPYVPEDLRWYDHDVVLQRLAEQRMQGGLEHSQLQFNRREISGLSTAEQHKVETEYSYLVGHATAEVEWGKSRERRQESDAALIMNVKFVSIAELQERSKADECENSDVLSNDDGKAKYRSLLMDCLQDGKISEDERRILERWQERCSITDEHAYALEQQALHGGSLTDAEQEYLEEYIFCNKDNKISTDESRLLQRHAERLAIPTERVKEIHSRAEQLKNLTDEMPMTLAGRWVRKLKYAFS